MPHLHAPLNVLDERSTVVHELPLTPLQYKTAIATAVAGCISCALVSLLLINIAVTVWRQHANPHITKVPLLKRQVVVFIICLLVSDWIQSITGILQGKWAMAGRIYQSSACTAQAVGMVVGDLGSTVWSSVIAAHTFTGVALGKQWSRSTVFATLLLGWSVVGVLSMVGPFAVESPENGPFYGISENWCAIPAPYSLYRLTLHYVPIFVADILITLFYGLVFLILQGRVTFFSRQISQSPTSLEEAILRDRVLVAKRMLYYPAAYLACISPIAISRVAQLAGANVPHAVWTFDFFMLLLLGAVDSVIYATTRHLVTFTSRSRFDSDSDIAFDSPATPKFIHSPGTSSKPVLDIDAFSVSIKEEGGSIRQQRDVGPRPDFNGAIRVTFERTEEIR